MSDEIVGRVFEHPRRGRVRVLQANPHVVEFEHVGGDATATEFRHTFERDCDPAGDHDG